jgi:hypothetical protein
MRGLMLLAVLLGTWSTSRAAPEPVELIGTASGFRSYRDWQSNYWRDDFQFMLKEQSTGRTWREIGKEWGVKYEGNCVYVPAADFDNDGDLDLLLVNFYSNAVLYRNETNDRSWLRVRAQRTKSSRDGIGARVTIFAERVPGKMVGFRQIQSGSGYGRCSPLEAHFGLGKTPAESYRVEVVFSASKTKVVVENVKPGRLLVVKEG